MSNKMKDYCEDRVKERVSSPLRGEAKVGVEKI